MSQTLQTSQVQLHSRQDMVQSMSVWKTLVKWLPPKSENNDWWWKTLGGHLTALLDLADYSLHAHYEALLFLYHRVAPQMGPRPWSTQPGWKSFMTDDHSPVEYSWKWSTGSGAPEVRYSIEPIGPFAGSRKDVLNQAATRDFLQRLAKSMPELDLTWFDHFSRALVGPGTPGHSSYNSSSESSAGRSTMFLAFEMVGGRIGVKAYFLPIETAERSASQQIMQAIRSAGCRNLDDAVQQLESNLLHDADRSDLRPFMLGIDCCVRRPEDSRLKIYARSTRTSFHFVRSVMSLGGRLPGLDAASDDFFDLWKRTLGLDPDARPETSLPRVDHETAGLLFYLDVAAKSADGESSSASSSGRLPDVKTYIPIRHYAQSDLQAAQGLRGYLEDHGRARYAQPYLQSLETLAIADGLHRATGVQTYITVAYEQRRQLYITSYFSPQIYLPSRWS